MSTATDWLRRRAQLSPERVALIEAATGRRVTYSDWNTQADRTARFLAARAGVGIGDRVAVLAGNSLEYLDIWFACQKLGAILQNLNWRLSVPELAALLTDAQPRVLIYSGEFAPQVEQLRGGAATSSVEAFIALDAPLAGDTCFAEREDGSARPYPMPSLELDHPWVICYTGGSTGLPKGVILTHGNILWNAFNTVLGWSLAAEDRAILNAPLFHTGALNVFTAPLVQAGGCSIVCERFEPGQVFDLLEAGQANLFFGVPTMFQLLQEDPRWAAADLSRLKLVISGGAPCPESVFGRFWDKGVDFRTGYGLTEAGPNNFGLPPAQVRAKLGAVGYPLPFVEARLTDLDNREVEAVDEPGQLLLRGPHRSPGYWNNPAATAEAIDDEGWLRTGDLASRDADGAYRIVGRLKEMFISGGENVYPAEVESVLSAHPAVAEASVFGLADPRWGEVGCAVVALRRDSRVHERELLRFAGERLARYKVPKKVLFVDELPKTGPGKIDKKALRALAAGGAVGQEP